MKRSLNLVFYYLILSTSLLAQEFAYVTDSLQLRVFSSASAESEVIQTIDSGDSVEIFTTEGGFTQVSTYDGTVGWVKSAFLVTDPPAKLLYFSVSEKNKQLEEEIEALKKSPQVNDDTSSNDQQAALIEQLQTDLAQQQENNQRLQNQLQESGANITPSEIQNMDTYSVINKRLALQILNTNKWWLIGIATAVLFLGMYLGTKFASRRMKKRLHGFSL